MACVAAIAALVLCAPSCATIGGFTSGNGAGGSLIVDGPLSVDGDLTVGGSALVHGPVRARKLSVGGSVIASLPPGETAGTAPQVVEGSMRVGGSLNVNGPLTVNGKLSVGGSLTTEQGEMPEAYTDLPPQ
jgi:cytoskeletal protein CcmA (bactofilin family)